MAGVGGSGRGDLVDVGTAVRGGGDGFDLVASGHQIHGDRLGLPGRPGTGPGEGQPGGDDRAVYRHVHGPVGRRTVGVAQFDGGRTGRGGGDGPLDRAADRVVVVHETAA